MIRYIAAGASALLLVAALFFIWRSGAEAQDVIPPAPPSAARSEAYGAGAGPRLGQPPAMSDQSREAKRFARADRNRDGRITLEEQLQSRRKAFAKADRDGNASLSFEEWTAPSAEKFAKADKDRSGWLDAGEYEASHPKPKEKPKCKC
ncbi:MAG: histidine kinase [Allosphingosinicella sp.]